MARQKSWKSGEIKSMQTFSYQISFSGSSQNSITINAVDTSKTIVPSTQSISQTFGVDGIAKNSRAHYLSSSTTVSGIARNSQGGSPTLYSAGAGHVVEYF